MLENISHKVVSRLAQRVQREATGYYCGYTFKGQSIGKKYLLKASQSLDYMTPELECKSAAQRMRRVSNRMFTDMMHRCTARPAAEEWKLATYAHDQDVTNAEFVRTFMSVVFPGGQLVQRLEGIADGVSLTHNRAPDPDHWADCPSTKSRHAYHGRTSDFDCRDCSHITVG